MNKERSAFDSFLIKQNCIHLITKQIENENKLSSDILKARLEKLEKEMEDN